MKHCSFSLKTGVHIKKGRHLFLPTGLEKMKKTALSNNDANSEDCHPLLILVQTSPNLPKAI